MTIDARVVSGGCLRAKKMSGVMQVRMRATVYSVCVTVFSGAIDAVSGLAVTAARRRAVSKS